MVRQGGRTIPHRAGRNAKAAIRLLDKLQVQEDEGTFEEIRSVRFDSWAAEWVDGLERKEGTKLSYGGTIRLANKTFGHKAVKKITPGDIRAFNVALRERGMSESTRAKHLRVLRKCFSDAVDHGFAAINPVKKLPSSEKPEPTTKEAAYFESAELPKLFAKIPEGLWRILFTTALKTGMRLGELCALDLGRREPLRGRHPRSALLDWWPARLTEEPQAPRRAHLERPGSRARCLVG